MTEQEWRALKKKHHICRECGKQDAYTFGGRSRCAECAQKDAERKREWRATPDGRENAHASHRRWRDRMAAEGLCIYCGKRKPSAGKKGCEWCLSKQRRYHANKRAASDVNRPRGANGYCWLCNKKKVIEGKRLCPECFERRVAVLTPEVAEKGRQTIRERMAK